MEEEKKRSIFSPKPKPVIKDVGPKVLRKGTFTKGTIPIQFSVIQK